MASRPGPDAGSGAGGSLFSALNVVERLGVGGKPYGSRVENRSVLVLQGSGGLTVIAEKHRGGASPPARDETMRLRDALDRFCR